MPERIGSKVLPIPTKSQLSLWSQLEALGEKQEPPRIYAGEVSGWVYPDARKKRDHTYSLSTFNAGIPEGEFIGLNKCWHMPSLSAFRKLCYLNKSLADRGML